MRQAPSPLDNLLRLHVRYYGEDPTEIRLSQQHCTFLQVFRHLNKARTRQRAGHSDRAEMPKISVGDSVAYRVHARHSKLDARWAPFYTVVKRLSPVTFLVKNQADGRTQKVHADDVHTVWRSSGGNLREKLHSLR